MVVVPRQAATKPAGLAASNSARSGRILRYLLILLCLASTAARIIESSADAPERYSTCLSWYIWEALAYFSEQIAGKGNIVEVGCFEGCTTNKFVREFLRGDTPFKLHAFDVWSDHVEEKSGAHYRGDELYERFVHNTGRHGGKVVPIRGRSQDTVPRWQSALNGTVALAYIDGDHHAEAVYHDAVNVWPMIRPGGFVIFDDYTWLDPESDPLNTPKAGVDRWLEERWGRDVKLWVKGYYLMVQKV